MKIYIPSLARAEQRHHTWETLPPSVQKNAYMVVGPKDAPAYLQRFPEDKVLIVDVKGIGKVRQHIIDISDGPVLMLDDDLSFFVRRPENPKLLQKATPTQIAAAFRLMKHQLKNYAHAAFAVREGANRCTDAEIYNVRCLRALGYNAAVLKEEGVRFDRLPVMEDFDVALQLLRKGYASVTINTLLQDQGTSNAPGGCSTYRSMEVQAKGAEGLAKLHPDFVRVVEKETKTAWGGQKRKDVNVQWKRAFSSAN